MIIKKRSYPFKVYSQDVDFQGKSTLMALGNMLLSTAGYNADDNGFGMKKMHEMNSAWVLTKLALEVEQFPQEYEEVHVETWVEEVERITTTRNFTIKDVHGNIIGNAGSHWVMIDMQTRRIKDLETLEGLRNYADNVASLIESPIKLTPIQGELIDTFKVKYNDIDINGHANSVRYIEWVTNCFSIDFYREKELKRFEINYISEALFGESLEIFQEEIAADDFRFEIRKNGKIACRARMVMRSR
ncbi:MAG: acyl-[acyl-carrier-protein] thioesterase [Bacteroidales bacterium]|jgi:acyl-ACP thioesterase|nr:acyl-[acyl-carrier-protein] thioesterase [Bacteroidales bacterium]